MKKELITPILIGGRFSITKIPGLLYEKFSKRYGIGKEYTVEFSGQQTKYRELQVLNQLDKANNKRVFIIYTEEPDDAAVETKFALLSKDPGNEHFRNFYQFEISATPQSSGWSAVNGNKYIETLRFNTEVVKNYLSVNHPMTDYVALALIEARLFEMNPKVAQLEYIDHAPKPPR